MNTRLLELRKKLKLTQEEFGQKLGVTKAGISKIEKGERNLTDTMAKLICSAFNVSEIWLKTGVGEMFSDSDIDDEFSWLAGKVLASDDVFMKKLLIYFMKFDNNQRENLKEFAKMLLED